MTKETTSVMIDMELAERMTARFESAGLRVRGMTNRGQRPIGIAALLDLADERSADFDRICKARAIASVYVQPARTPARRGDTKASKR